MIAYCHSDNEMVAILVMKLAKEDEAKAAHGLLMLH
jgi:hypothetical protein